MKLPWQHIIRQPIQTPNTGTVMLMAGKSKRNKNAHLMKKKTEIANEVSPPPPNAHSLKTKFWFNLLSESVSTAM
jgi:hypothetical protein